MKTGIPLTNAQPASMACSTYHLVAISEPTGRKLTTTSVFVSCSSLTISAVGPGALVIIPQVFAKPVMGHAAHDRGIQVRDVRELVGIVRFGEDGFGKVFADLGDVHVNAERELDITDVIAAEPRVHDAGTWHHPFLFL
jgi:hypothetical protein